MKVTAKQKMSYGRKRYEIGEEIEMSEKDAKLLAATKRVSIAEQQASPEAPQKAPREEPHEDEERRGTKGKKGTYKRRDQQAERTGEDEADKGE